MGKTVSHAAPHAGASSAGDPTTRTCRKPALWWERACNPKRRDPDLRPPQHSEYQRTHETPLSWLMPATLESCRRGRRD